MKKLSLILVTTALLTACAKPQSSTSEAGVYDMQAVQEYNARVASGRTVTAEQKKRAQKQVVDMPMNASDRYGKNKAGMNNSVGVSPVIVPMIGYGYYRRY